MVKRKSSDLELQVSELAWPSSSPSFLLTQFVSVKFPEPTQEYRHPDVMTGPMGYKGLQLSYYRASSTRRLGEALYKPSLAGHFSLKKKKIKYNQTMSFDNASNDTL